MAIDSRHKDALKYKEDWYLIKTLKEGQRALITAGNKFLPKLSGQTASEYEAYIKKGSLFNALDKTINGLIGAIVRKKPVIKVPANINLESVTISGQNIYEVINATVDEIMSYGFFGILVDQPEDAKAGDIPNMAPYGSLDILNWFTHRSGTEEKLVMITLYETELEQDSEDLFEFKINEIIRCCYIDAADGIYKQQKWKKVDKKSSKDQWVKYGNEIIPKRTGKSMDEIPFTFFTTSGNYACPSKPPLLDLANLNIKHWQLSTDYYHALHYCAIPTPWAAGFQAGQNLYLGAQKAWIAEEPTAQCGFLEFTGQGVGAIEKGLDKIEKQMAVAGARLLEEQKAGIEAAEAIRLRISGDDATLGTIVTTIEQGFIKVFGYIIGWSSMTDNTKASVEMNREFVASKLTAQEITALLQACQSGKISTDTFIYNLQMGEYLPPDRTIKDEKDLIDAEKPAEFAGGIPGQIGGIPGQQNNIPNNVINMNKGGGNQNVG